jgi:cytochrome c oxidase subunit 2
MMFAEIHLFPESVSTNAHLVDALFLFLISVTGVVALGVCIAILVFSARYRRKKQDHPTPRILGSLRLELIWTIGPLLVFLVMFFWGASIYFSLAQPPAEAIDVYVVGKQWMWKLQHPQGQREINQLHVPVGRPVKLTLTSEDVIHDFFLPNFRTKIDVLPGRYVYTWFQATQVGTYPIYCAEYCGTNHAGMKGEIVVMEPHAYESWLQNHVEGSLALEGRKLFLKLQCITCHSANAKARAPVLENLAGQQVPLRGGKIVTADATYLRESIVDPQAKVVLGWEPIMPTYRGQVDEEELVKLIAFIKSLGAGETPSRTEETEPPPENEPRRPETSTPKNDNPLRAPSGGKR